MVEFNFNKSYLLKNIKSISNKQLRIYLIILIVVFITGVFSIGYNYYRINQFKEDYFTKQRELLQSLKIQSQSSLQGLFSDLILLSNLSSTKNIFLSKTTEQNLVKDFSAFIKTRQSYNQIRFIDLDGNEQIRINYNKGIITSVNSDKLQNKAHRNYFEKSIQLKPGEIYVSKIDLNIENKIVEKPNKPVIRVATPVVNDNSEIIGIVVINYLAAELLDQITIKKLNYGNKIEVLNNKGYWLTDIKDKYDSITDDLNAYSNKYPKLWQDIQSNKKGILNNDSLLLIYEKFSLIDVFHNNFDSIAKLKNTDNPELIIISSVSDKKFTQIANAELYKFIFLILSFITIIAFIGWYLFKKQKEINHTYDKFDAVFNHSVQFIGLTNSLGDLIEINDTLLHFGGFTQKQVVRKKIWDLPLWNDNKEVVDELKRSINNALNGDFIRYEVDIVGAENKKITIDFSLSPVTDHNNNVIYVICEGRDITEKNELQKSIIETNQLFTEIQNVAKIGVWKANLTSKEVYWSDEVYNIHEVEVGTAIDINKGIKYYHPDYQKVVENAINKAISENKSWDEEAILITTTGKKIWVRTLGYPVFINNELKELQGLFMDIDDKKQAQLAELKGKEKLKELNIELEKLLSERTKRLEYTANELDEQLSAIDSTTVISITDIEGNIIHVNDTFCEISGYSKDELIGKNHRMLKSGQHQTSFFTGMFATLAQNITWKGEICNRKKDGNLYWLLTYIYPFKDENGQIKKYISVRFDITKLKENEQQLKKQTQSLAMTNARLDSVNKELETFSYSVSHDLKAPLRALQGFSDNLQKKYKDQFDETGLRWLEFIKVNAERMNQLIIDILSFSRINRMDINKTSLDINTIVKQQIEQVTKSYQNKLKIEISNLPECEGDQSMIEMVWQNLITNAFKYSSKNSIIEIKIDGYTDDLYANYSIKDNGVGFDMKYYDKLFGVFQRLHNNDEYEGTGVGLANVKRIIEKHEGTIKAESEPNKGSIFEFKLPLKTI